jgi:hypothetical protein
MQSLTEIFELERCSHTVCSNEKESLASSGRVMVMPPPQKFSARSGVTQGRRHECEETSAMAKEKQIRLIGEMINREESAKWACGEEESQRSASFTASLIAGFKTSCSTSS